MSGGTEPKQMLMILEDDLVDELNPGDKVRITGTLRTFREERATITISYFRHNITFNAIIAKATWDRRV